MITATPNETSLHRLNLEKALIGAVLLENSYGRIGRFLSPKNFSKEDHKKIWQTIEALWPSNPIDLLTVHHRLIAARKINLSYYLAQCTCKVNNASNIEYHAVCLLEIDIREKLLKKLKNAAGEVKDPELRTSLHEIWLEVHSNPSKVFTTLQEATEFLRISAPDLAITKGVIEYNDLIQKGIEQIKYNSQVRTLIKNLENLCPGDINKNLAVSHLSEMLLMVINCKTVPEKFINRILEIKKSIAA